MTLREFVDADQDALRKIHLAEAMPYKFPDLSSPLFIVRRVLEDDGKLLAAAMLRLTAECYLLLDRNSGTARDRWRGLILLHEAVRGEAVRRGLDDVHCWLPPGVAAPFGRRLVQLEWEREQWSCYARSVADRTPLMTESEQRI